MKTIRCAIYTRKSSDEGLEQDFNSLHAQREACSAYVLSQASEGWKLLPEHYDDGGLSGGTLERPALQRLLADVKAGSIDIIVVYKVDRLTRSLLDFAKLVDMLDAASTSFVSVTQSFNTTTSMGRLTLNMLLSFAQFEREVTAERIRDKIAASKAKGMWMGGSPPLGYRPEGRSLAIVDDHAVLVREIYERYLATGNVRLVAEGLLKEQITTPSRVSGKGQAYGGRPFTRGQLYAILRSPIYAGDIPHKGKVFPGNHPAIIERETWDAVQALLTSNIKGHRREREQRCNLLAGLLTDASGEPLIPVHTNKGKVRYRYYVSKIPDLGALKTGAPTLRLPTREIEQVVKQALGALFCDAWGLFARLKVSVAPSMLAGITERCSELSSKFARADRALLLSVVSQIAVHHDRLVFSLSADGLAELLGFDEQPEAPEQCLFEAPMRLTRTGRAVRLIHESDAPVLGDTPDASLIRLILKARRWWGELLKGEINIKSLAARESVTNSYVTRVVRLAFLAPQVVEATLSGNVRAGVSGVNLLRTDAIASDWREQVKAMLADTA